MMETILFVFLGMAMLAAVVALLRRPAAVLPSQVAGAAVNLEELAARHSRYFPQMRQALSPADEAYLTSRASPGVFHEWRDSHRRVMRGFLAGLCEDFERLSRMARAVSRVAPQLDNLREAELFWLGLRFRLFYRLALLELSLGYRPVNSYLRLNAIIGGLGNNLERAAAVLAEESAAG